MTSKSEAAISMSGQLDLFKYYIVKLKALVGEDRTNFILANSLFFVVLGSNDIYNTYYLSHMRQVEYDFPAYSDFLVNSAYNFYKDMKWKTKGVVAQEQLLIYVAVWMSHVSMIWIMCFGTVFTQLNLFTKNLFPLFSSNTKNQYECGSFLRSLEKNVYSGEDKTLIRDGCRENDVDEKENNHEDEATTSENNRAETNRNVKKDKQKEKSETVPFHKLFSFADSTNTLLMTVGTICAIGDILGSPLMNFLLSQTIDSFGSNQSNTTHVVEHVSKATLHEVILLMAGNLIYLKVSVF